MEAQVHDQLRSDTPETQVTILLCGGPVEHLEQHERVRIVPDPDVAVKVHQGAYYDHYVPTAERTRIEGREVRVHIWSHRTFVAE